MEKVNKVNPINFLRVAALMCVFFFHTSMFSNQLGFSFSASSWFLKTPAWGAVWIFFIISGYLIGQGFLSGRYGRGTSPYAVKNVFRFYLNRVIKIGIPVWFFSLLACVLAEPEFIANNPKTLINILTFTYYNIPSSNALCITWYVSSLMQLYLLAPLFCWAIDKIMQKRSEKTRHLISIAGIVLLIGLGFLLREWLRSKGYDWSSMIYVPFWGNLDMFFCGTLLYYLRDFNPEKIKKTIFKFFSVVFFVGLIIFNCYIYYLSETVPEWMSVYQYVLPSVYIIAVLLYLYSFETDNSKYLPINAGNIRKNPLRLVDALAGISFEFYLFHSVILFRIYQYVPNLGDGGNNHLQLLLYAFVITSIIAYGFGRIFKQGSNG